jgi:hypothetical protein
MHQLIGGLSIRKYVDTLLLDLGSVDINGVIDTMSHIRYMVVHDDMVVCSSIHIYTMVYGGVQCVFGTFSLGRPPDRDFRYIIELVHLGTISGWTSLMERNIPRRIIFDWDITRVGTKSMILA